MGEILSAQRRRSEEQEMVQFWAVNLLLALLENMRWKADEVNTVFVEPSRPEDRLVLPRAAECGDGAI